MKRLLIALACFPWSLAVFASLQWGIAAILIQSSALTVFCVVMARKETNANTPKRP